MNRSVQEVLLLDVLMDGWMDVLVMVAELMVLYLHSPHCELFDNDFLRLRRFLN